MTTEYSLDTYLQGICVYLVSEGAFLSKKKQEFLFFYEKMVEYLCVKKYCDTKRYMVRKLFVGISLDAKANTSLDRNLREFSSFPVFWTEASDRHITMAFLGNVEDEYLLNISEGIYTSLKDLDAFDVFLESISSGFSGDRLKSITARVQESEELDTLHARLAKELKSFVRIEKKRFRPHVTLGRFRRFGGDGVEEKQKYQVEKRIRIPVFVSSVTLFESVQEKNKKTYVPIDVFDI